ncbi:hypothetical protein K450DRAFT_253133 [Umbelopsis ramanniana AG]|uniref:Uncharacterized protein n=1 Tax=Umbelopsis ramanniana AG TaxID=1314678 RepID=A0AAD5E4D4_UMBRA|nr:uncharacterized protein K450DRAFT_253133 [Umbelopsis ramanniana AG]KAI8577161.1 hypothetical protein K450DRAFT_253133 [Umbelopsis ramanniana AG]
MSLEMCPPNMAMGIIKKFFFHLSRTANIIYVHVFRNLYHRSSITKILSSSSGESSSAAAAVDSSHLSMSHAGQGIPSLGRESSNGDDSASVRTVGMSIGDDRTASVMMVRSTFGFFLSLIIFISSVRNISTLKSRCISRTLCILWTLRDFSQNILGSTVKY